MKEVDEFLECLLGLVLPGNIGEAGLHITLGIDLRTGVSQREETTVGAFHHLIGTRTPNPIEDQTRQNPPQEEINNGGVLLWQLFGEDDMAALGRTFRLEQTVNKLRIVDLCGTEILVAFLSGHLIIDATFLDVDTLDRALIHCRDKGVVVSILYRLVSHVRKKETVK